MTTKLTIRGSGIVLATRDKATDIARDIYSTLGQSPGRIVLDFSEVHAVSPSFADEFIGRLAESLRIRQRGGVLRIVGARPAVKDVFQSVLRRRDSSPLAVKLQ